MAGSFLFVPAASVASRDRAAMVRDNRIMSYMNGNGGGKVLVRRRDNRIIAGVCAGVADYTGMDVNLVRVLWAVVTLFTVGIGILAYAIAWAVIPEEGSKTSIVEDLISQNRSR
jgi:phage shock protein PspC (stress-responsive transcriptional regulator)